MHFTHGHERKSKRLRLDLLAPMTEADTLRSGACPICGAGPFRLPLGHVSNAHGIPGRAARLEFGCTLTETLCAAEHHQRVVERNLALRARPTARRQGTYRCAACGATFEARTYRDDQGIARYCCKGCKRRGAQRVSAPLGAESGHGTVPLFPMTPGTDTSRREQR